MSAASTRSSSAVSCAVPRGILIELRLTGPDGARWATKLIEKMVYLANRGVASADFPPTDQQLEVLQLLEEQMATAQSQLDELLDRDLAAFNELLRTRNVSNIIAQVPTR